MKGKVEIDRAPGLRLPRSVLFMCRLNMVRSPMAEAIGRHYFRHQIHFASCGIRQGKIDPFAIAAMQETGLDISRHHSQEYDMLADDYFDLIISLAPEAHHRAVEMTRTMAVEIEYWPIQDPSLSRGAREQRLEEYRHVRDQLFIRIRKRFGGLAPPVV